MPIEYKVSTPPQDLLSHPPSRQRGGGCLPALGCLFLVGAIALFISLFAVMLIPDAITPLSPIFCPEGSTLTVKYNQYRRGETEFYPMCVNDAGREVADPGLAIIGGGVMAILALTTLGILFLVWGSVKIVGQTETVKTTFSFPPSGASPTATMGGTSPKQRLEALQAAYDGGLLTREEYDRKRAEILADF